jgi:hypothetical protein
MLAANLMGVTMSKTRKKLVTLGSVHVGAKFVFRSADILGERFSGRKPPFEGQVLTVVWFEPKYKNNVVVQDVNGTESLMPLGMVEKGLQSRQVLM